MRGAPHSILACKRHLIINAQKVNTRYCFKLTLVLNLLSYLKHPGTFRTLLAPINNVVVKLIMYCNHGGLLRLRAYSLDSHHWGRCGAHTHLSARQQAAWTEGALFQVWNLTRIFHGIVLMSLIKNYWFCSFVFEWFGEIPSMIIIIAILLALHHSICKQAYVLHHLRIYGNFFFFK